MGGFLRILFGRSLLTRSLAYKDNRDEHGSHDENGDRKIEVFCSFNQAWRVGIAGRGERRGGPTVQKDDLEDSSRRFCHLPIPPASP